jgi:phosphonoacetaldehyde hydrolase
MTHSDGPLLAVLFDWAGTTVDYGSRAPAIAMTEIFRRCGVEITIAEAREPMGLAKRDHIAAIAAMPRVQRLWQAIYGHSASSEDIDRMYHDFLPLQKEILATNSELIPGVSNAVAACRARGLKIGSSTGYTRELMEVVASHAEAGGYIPDTIVCPDEVREGRPAPWLNFRAAENLNVYPMSRVVIVDDTPAGIAAGRNAGCITVAITQTGNMLGLSENEVNKIPSGELDTRLIHIAKQFHGIGAHHVIRSVAELPDLIDEING